MLICSGCGKKNPDEAVFCQYCGKSLEEERRLAEEERKAEEEKRRAEAEAAKKAAQARKEAERKKALALEEEKRRRAEQEEKKGLNRKLREKAFTLTALEGILNGTDAREVRIYRDERSDHAHELLKTDGQNTELTDHVAAIASAMCMILAAFTPLVELGGWIGEIVDGLFGESQANAFQILQAVTHGESDEIFGLLVITALIFIGGLFFSAWQLYQKYLTATEVTQWRRTLTMSATYGICASVIAFVAITIFNAKVSEEYYPSKMVHAGIAVWMMLISSILINAYCYYMEKYYSGTITSAASAKGTLEIKDYDPILSVRPVSIEVREKNGQLEMILSVKDSLDQQFEYLEADLWLQFPDETKAVLRNVRFKPPGYLLSAVGNGNLLYAEQPLSAVGLTPYTLRQFSSCLCFIRNYKYKQESKEVVGSRCYCMGAPAEDPQFKALLHNQPEPVSDDVSLREMQENYQVLEDRIRTLREQLSRIIQSSAETRLTIPMRDIQQKKTEPASTPVKVERVSDKPEEPVHMSKEQDIEHLEIKINHFCPYCGHNVHDMRFCGYCGKEVNP